ncbi:Imm1 family immunity protein [Aquihabitans daechungensis]|uniref:Imm1 family immunity protein n=1 Tax=Aquihabitans daechungensis TaxID=1052257 RepID=UPI003BA234A2
MSWFDGEAHRSEVIDTADEGSALLRSERVDGDELPPLLDFQHPDGGPSLTIGADDPTVVTYQDLDPPYYVSVGSEQAVGTMWFQFGGSESEFLASSAVRAESAVEALRQFFESADLPDAIVWTEV